MPLPAGFRESATGLIVPEAHSRKRELWTRDEWKTIDRATKLLEARGVSVFFGCPHCPGAPMERIRRNDGGLTLQCDCTAREFTKV